jgi:hypothetical protein
LNGLLLPSKSNRRFSEIEIERELSPNIRGTIATDSRKMNFFLPGFFNQIQNLPASFLHQIENDENVSFSTTILVTLLLTMTTVEAVILVVFTVYSCCCRLRLDPTGFLWLEEDDEEDEYIECWVERSRRIQEALEEKRYELLLVGPDRPSCCPICLNNYESNDLVAGASKCCRHVFHKSCLVRWLRNQSSCPYCRQELLKSSKEKMLPSEPSSTSTTTSFSSVTHYISSRPEATPEYPFEVPDFWFFLF